MHIKEGMEGWRGHWISVENRSAFIELLTKKDLNITE
jgi:hypothetical protein